MIRRTGNLTPTMFTESQESCLVVRVMECTVSISSLHVNFA